MENKLLDFRKNIEVETSGSILLTSRGDGLQARLIPDILDELTDDRRYVIWGFEEPENSYEYRHSKKLADEFYHKFSDNIQIFITTHAKEFLGISDIDGLGKVSIYRVFKGKNNGSKVEFYNEDKGFSEKKIRGIFSEGNEQLTKDEERALQKIYDDLGIIDEARVISKLESEIKDLKFEKGDREKLIVTLENQIKEFKKEKIENEELKQENLNLKEEVVKLKEQNKIIIFCENQNAQVLNDLGFKNIHFLGSQNKIKAFDPAKNKGCGVYAIIDRDYITDDERLLIHNNTNVRLTEAYCFENYLYHPDNLSEYYTSKKLSLNIIDYTDNIMSEVEKFSTINIGGARKGYEEIILYLTNNFNYKKDTSQLEKFKFSHDFIEVYKFFSMKDNCKQLKERQNINKNELSKTKWFRNQIKVLIESMGINIEE